jgi:hypothetical protein
VGTKVVDDRYYEIISAPDAWQICQDYAEVGLRPTNSALRIRDLVEQVTGELTGSGLLFLRSLLTIAPADRYRPLPSFSHRLPFLLNIQLPLLEAYLARIVSAVDAFETLSHGFVRAVAVPGTLGETSGGHLTAGVTGLQRLLRAGISSRWMEGVCRGWGDDVVRQL